MGHNSGVIVAHRVLQIQLQRTNPLSHLWNSIPCRSFCIPAACKFDHENVRKAASQHRVALLSTTRETLGFKRTIRINGTTIERTIVVVGNDDGNHQRARRVIVDKFEISDESVVMRRESSCFIILSDSRKIRSKSENRCVESITGSLCEVTKSLPTIHNIPIQIYRHCSIKVILIL